MIPYASSYKQLQLNSVDFKRHENRKQEELGEMKKGVSRSGRGTREGKRSQYDNNTLYIYMRLSKIKNRYLKRRIFINVGLLRFSKGSYTWHLYLHIGPIHWLTLWKALPSIPTNNLKC